MSCKFTHILALAVSLFLVSSGIEGREMAGRHDVELSWGVSVPVNSVFFADGPGAGFAAASLRYEYRIIPSLAVGLSISYDGISAQGVTEDNFQDGSFNTRWSERSQKLVPVLATLKWYPLGGSLLRPYIGVGAGAAWGCWELSGETISRREHAEIGFALSPEIGVRVHPLSFLFLDLRCSYRYASVSWDYPGIKGVHGIYPSIGVGMAF